MLTSGIWGVAVGDDAVQDSVRNLGLRGPVLSEGVKHWMRDLRIVSGGTRFWNLIGQRSDVDC